MLGHHLSVESDDRRAAQAQRAARGPSATVMVSRSPPRVNSVTGEVVRPRAQSTTAVAAAPVPQARVSPSTPRSKVRNRQAPPAPRASTQSTLVPAGANAACQRNGGPSAATSTASTSSTGTTRCGTPVSQV